MNLPTDKIFNEKHISISDFYVKFSMWVWGNNNFNLITSPSNGEMVGICCNYLNFLKENDCIKITGSGTLATVSYTGKRIPIFTN